MRVYGLKKARDQAQANANRTGKRWVLWDWGASPSSGYNIQEDWPTRSFDNVEKFEPEKKQD